MGNHLLHPLWLLAVAMASATHRSCERRDGDCPPCQPARSLSPTAAVTLSDKEPELVASAKWAESVLTGFGNRTDIIRFDNPTTGLHTSLFYFCCHTVGEVEQMLSALGRMEWKSVTIDYDTAGCNLDHDNHTVYIRECASR